VVFHRFRNSAYIRLVLVVVIYLHISILHGLLLTEGKCVIRQNICNDNNDADNNNNYHYY